MFFLIHSYILVIVLPLDILETLSNKNLIFLNMIKEELKMLSSSEL